MSRLSPWLILVIGMWPATLAFAQSASQTPSEAVVQAPCSDAPPARAPEAAAPSGTNCPCQAPTGPAPAEVARQNSATTSPDPAPSAPSQGSLGGPVAEVVAGGVVVLFAPLATMTVVGMAHTDICLAEEDEDCASHFTEQDARIERWALGIGIPVTLLGAALLVHGAYRIRVVKQQRRTRALAGLSLDVAQDRAMLNWQTSF